MVGRRDEVTSGDLGERLEEGHGEVVAQTRHLPVEAGVLDAVEDRGGDVHGDAVGLGARGELIGHLEVEIALAPGPGVVIRGDLLTGVGAQEVLGEGEQVRSEAPLPSPPAVEGALGVDVRGDACVEEGEEHVVVHCEVAAAGALLQLRDPGDGGLIGLPEGVDRLPVPFDQGSPDEDLARGLGVDSGVLDGAIGDEGDPVQSDALGGDDSTLTLGPAGFTDRTRDDVGAEFLGPFGFDARVGAGPQTRGLDEFGGHDVVGLLAEEDRSGSDGEPRAARPGILPLCLITKPDMTEEPREEGLVNAIPVGCGVAM